MVAILGLWWPSWSHGGHFGRHFCDVIDAQGARILLRMLKEALLLDCQFLYCMGNYVAVVLLRTRAVRRIHS